MASNQLVGVNDGYCTTCGTFLKNFYTIDAKRCQRCLSKFPMFDFIRRVDGFRKCLRCNHLSHGSWKFCRTCGLQKLAAHEKMYLDIPVPPSPQQNLSAYSTVMEGEIQLEKKREELEELEDAMLVEAERESVAAMNMDTNNRQDIIQDIETGNGSNVEIDEDRNSEESH